MPTDSDRLSACVDQMPTDSYYLPTYGNTMSGSRNFVSAYRDQMSACGD